jgi:hypothetical protein
MKKLTVLGIIGGAALLAAVPFSIQWSQTNGGSAGPTMLLTLSQAEAATVGMERRQARRTGRQERRKGSGRPVYRLRYSRLSRALGTNDRGGRNDGDGDHVATPPPPENYARRRRAGDQVPRGSILQHLTLSKAVLAAPTDRGRTTDAPSSRARDCRLP